MPIDFRRRIANDLDRFAFNYCDNNIAAHGQNRF